MCVSVCERVSQLKKLLLLVSALIAGDSCKITQQQLKNR